jgi:hypothetical protein
MRRAFTALPVGRNISRRVDSRGANGRMPSIVSWCLSSSKRLGGAHECQGALTLRIGRKTLAATLALLAVLAGAGPALASPGNGADVVNESGCVPEGPVTDCSYTRFVTNETVTPSGNVSAVGAGTQGYELIGGGSECTVFSGSYRVQTHVLYKDGAVREISNRNAGESSIACSWASATCTFGAHLHYANGELQFDRRELECIR